MDNRIFLAGFVPVLIVTSGCILIGSSYGLPFVTIIGLLLMILPFIFMIWYILIRIENLIAGVKVQGRTIHRALDEQATDLKRRYDETTRNVLDLQSDLTRRVYR